MNALSANTLIIAVEAVDLEIRRINRSVKGKLENLLPDVQETLLTYSNAATELKAYYQTLSEANPSMPPYEEIVPEE